MGTTGGGGGGQRPKVLCTENRPPIWRPFNKFHFFPEEKFLEGGGFLPLSNGLNPQPQHHR